MKSKYDLKAEGWVWVLGEVSLWWPVSGGNLHSSLIFVFNCERLRDGGIP